MTTPSPDAPGHARARGIARARTLFRLWRHEKEDPEPFYSLLAAEAAEDLERRYGALDGTLIADVGCGPGYYAAALRARGARVVPVEGALDELLASGTAPSGAVVADASRLALPDGSVDGVFCSNMLEHTPDPPGVIQEMARVLAPGGWAYLSWTNWYSPWGGHDMSPYHYLGPDLGPRLYERRHGPPRKNRMGEGLFAVHIGTTLRDVEAESRLEITDVEPRYWPWARGLTRIPGVREVLTWNCVIRVRRRVDDPLRSQVVP